MQKNFPMNFKTVYLSHIYSHPIPDLGLVLNAPKAWLFVCLVLNAPKCLPPNKQTATPLHPWLIITWLLL